MKKKFLSLMMAAAVVATTSVSAFAEDYSWSENHDKEINVDITGNVKNQNGNIKPGSLSVSVPTTASFTVNNDRAVQGTPAAVQGASIRVENKGTIPVDVYAYKFVDQTPNDDKSITIVGKADLSQKTSTSTLSLKLNGNRGHAHLKSEPTETGKGIFKDEDCATRAETEGVKLAYVDASAYQDITLTGETGSNATAPESAVEDNFVLTLKIKKAQP